uniref:VWFA domain-containing protein n=1 Tax=Amphimedon queenslandica TaxID=400682 RepID=A0A1X7ST07_AMPQE
DIDEACTVNVEAQHCSLVCPLSGTRIHHPVRVAADMTQGPFDKENILAKIESDNNFVQFGKLTKEQLKTDFETAKLLMYFPWETDEKVCIWTNSPKNEITKVCKKVNVPFKWYEMLHSLPELHILNPQGLYSGDECLTYNSEAHLIYFLGSTKNTDEKRRFYNACESDYQQVITKSKLEEIGKLDGLEMQVTADIKKVIQKDSDEIQNYDKISAEYFRTGDIRLDAAKQLFNSFATRTQAYKLHHALGLTVFGSEVTVILELSKNTEKFETSLEDVEIDGSTELTAAVVNAVQQLKKFNCKR